MPKKTPTKKAPARKAKKMVRSVFVRKSSYWGFYVALSEVDFRLGAPNLCAQECSRIFDVQGMKAGDTREFKVTTEVVSEKKARKQ